MANTELTRDQLHAVSGGALPPTVLVGPGSRSWIHPSDCEVDSIDNDSQFAPSPVSFKGLTHSSYNLKSPPGIKLTP